MATEPTTLTEEQKDELIQRIRDCDKAQQEIQQAIRAGIPIGDAQEQLNDTRAKLMKMKQVYAPNRVI